MSQDRPKDFFQVMLSTFLVPSTLYFTSNYWVYPLNDYIGDTGCYMLIYIRDIENFIIQLHSLFMATFRYVCLFHDNLLLKFNLSPNVSNIFFYIFVTHFFSTNFLKDHWYSKPSVCIWYFKLMFSGFCKNHLFIECFDSNTLMDIHFQWQL